MERCPIGLAKTGIRRWWMPDLRRFYPHLARYVEKATKAWDRSLKQTLTTSRCLMASIFEGYVIIGRTSREDHSRLDPKSECTIQMMKGRLKKKVASLSISKADRFVQQMDSRSYAPIFPNLVIACLRCAEKGWESSYLFSHIQNCHYLAKERPLFLLLWRYNV